MKKVLIYFIYLLLSSSIAYGAEPGEKRAREQDVVEASKRAKRSDDLSESDSLSFPAIELLREQLDEEGEIIEEDESTDDERDFPSSSAGASKKNRSKDITSQKHAPIRENEVFKAFLSEKLPLYNWSLSKVRLEWNKNHPEGTINLSTSQKYMKWAADNEPSVEIKELAKKYSEQPRVGYNTNKIQSIPELKQFFETHYDPKNAITPGSKRLASLWNAEHPNQKLSHFVFYRYIRNIKERTSAFGSSDASLSSAQDMNTSE